MALRAVLSQTQVGRHDPLQGTQLLFLQMVLDNFSLRGRRSGGRAHVRLVRIRPLINQLRCGVPMDSILHLKIGHTQSIWLPGTSGGSLAA